jgi:hypothetical protein
MQPECASDRAEEYAVTPNEIIRGNEAFPESVKAMKLIEFVAAGMSALMALVASAAPAPNQWEQPAEALAEQIAGILGPGQAQLAIRNISTVSGDEIPVIRKLLIQDLKARGVTASGAESANSIRVTLSENARERLWVAEVVEGSETRVTMVHLEAGAPKQAQAPGGLVLHRQLVFASREPLLATLEIPNGLIALEPEQIVIYTRAGGGWHELKRVTIGQTRPLTRDPRGILLAGANGAGFEARFAGMRCSGSQTDAQPAGDWTVRCRESDDPWSLFRSTANGPTAINAFYNAGRDYFTGVVTPNIGVDLPQFYSAALIPRPAGEVALLVNGIDGKVQLVDSGALKTVSGARDWGSDLAALHSSCGASTQIIASSSGEAASDSLCAYELPGLEAVPDSAPLAMNGAVTALWTSSDGESVLAIVHGAADQYEVDRVTASCD